MSKYQINQEPNLKVAALRSKKETHSCYQELNYSTRLKEFAQGKKALVITHGCVGNSRDSELIKSILLEAGFILTEDENESDLVIFNTCAIRQGAQEKVFGEIGRFKMKKLSCNKPLLAICGCMAQQENVVEKIKETYRYIDLVFGTHNIHHLPELLDQVISGQKVIDVHSIEGEVFEINQNFRHSKYKALVNIMYGCDKFCSYCIVPFVRGRQRSRQHLDILKEVEYLVANNYQEITLVGQNVNAYGKDLKDGITFANLLEKVAKTGIKRLRFLTSHPWDFSDQMIEVIAKYPNIMKQLHLPLQSGDDQILKMMNRRYTSQDYLNLYFKLKDKIPEIAISTDIIVGFPNESQQQFENTLKIVDLAKFDGAFTFIYSPRQGTVASKINDDTPIEVKQKRLEKLNKLVSKYNNLNNQLYLNQTVEVLVEGVSKKNKEKYSGYTQTLKLVNFTSNQKLESGMLVKVKINNVKSWTLEGIYEH